MDERDRTDTIAEIEETQEALRHSIEQSRQLSERAQQLLERHRRDPSILPVRAADGEGDHPQGGGGAIRTR